MTPTDFELYVAQLFKDKGYIIDLTPKSGDYGIDVFAFKGAEKIAIQVKMYGGSSRKVNRKCVMELYGASKYFDCTHAMIATNGALLSDARIVADKLDIEILEVNLSTEQIVTTNISEGQKFEAVWEKYIMPLQNKKLYRANGECNTITRVDWACIERISSKGRPGRIDIEIFKEAFNVLVTHKVVTREYINQNYVARASSGVLLILSQIPFIELLDKPSRLVMRL